VRKGGETIINPPFKIQKRGKKESFTLLKMGNQSDKKEAKHNTLADHLDRKKKGEKTYGEKR